jgi:hypothetical protein
MTIDAAQIELLKLLGGGAGSGTGLGSLLGDLGSSSASTGLLSQALTGNVGGVLQSSPLLSGGLGSALTGGGGIGGGLLGLSPILAGLRALFGGSSQPALPELTKYGAPDSLSVSLGLGDGGRSFGAVSYGQGGAPRLAPSITVNVNAIDSQSFSDHSDAIARVVREAMLNSGALTDVVGEI